MGDSKLCLLLLLLSAYTLAQQDGAEGQPSTCPLAKRYKNFRRFVYQYEAETHNGVNGASSLKNGPKVTCKVEIEVPQTCSFILRTTECSLSEVIDVGEEGTPVFGPAANAEAFQVAMEKNPLKVLVEGQNEVKLFPEEDELTTILNIKRGIISALLVPVLEEEKNKEMATIHGVCDTDFTVNVREDIATDVTITRDLSTCDSFYAQRDHTSPLALISGMQHPLSKLISSTQTCNYKFDNQKKHMTAGTCTEKHIFLPFSHQNEHGVSSLVKQTLTLQETSKINDRVFDHNEANLKTLAMEAAEDKAPIQTKDAVLATLSELNTLSQTSQGHQRASTFQRLVSELRGLNSNSVLPAVRDMSDISSPLTWQALAQCGTPECSSAMLMLLREFQPDSAEVDAVVYALGLLPNPSRLLVKDMLAMAQYQQSKAIMYAMSNTVRKLYQSEGKVTPEITAVYEFMANLLGADCAGEKELTFLALRVVGNMGEAMVAAEPGIKTTLLKCMRQPATTLSVQLAAIQAFKRMPVTDEVRSNLQRVSQYAKGAVQKRLAAYLIVMRQPEASDLELVKKILTQESNMQVKAFVASHIYNIINSNDPETKKLAMKITKVLQDIDVATHTEFTSKSRNYKMEASLPGLQTGMQGNMIFDPTSQLPKEVMLETTLKAFGYDLDMWEVGMEGKGFEPTIEALFGKNGFFPDTVSKAIYWAGEKMPSKVNDLLKSWAAPLKSEKMKVPENLMREIVRNFNKLAKDLQAQESPEAMAYLSIMGTELGYIKGGDLKQIAYNAAMYAEIFMKTIPKEVFQGLLKGTDNELFAHYIFMDNKFSLPTASGFPLRFALSGTFAPGAKGAIDLSPFRNKVSFMPSVGVEFVTKMGVHIPEFVVSAVEMHTNIYHESALNAKITLDQNQIKLSIPAPERTTQLFRVSNRVLTVTSGQTTLIPPMEEGRTNVVSCRKLFSGVEACTTVRYSIASPNGAAPYFPLNGETKFAVDIQPTGEVTEYTATLAYELLAEGKESRQKVDSLKMILRAEGAEPTEATATMKYNRNRNTLSTSIQIPDYDVEAGIRVGLADSSAKGKSITIEISNKNIPQLSLIGRAKLDAMTDGLLQVRLMVPSLQTDASLTATMRNSEGLTLEIQSDIKLPETSSVQGVIFKYAEDQVEVQLMSDMSSEIQNLVPEAFQSWLQQLAEDILDQKVVKTDMKLRHIFSKSLEAGNIWLDKITNDVRFVETLRNNVPEMPNDMPSMPEKLFLKSESTFKYQFNKNRVTITIPVPLGGKSSEELRIPRSFATPRLAVPEIGLMLPSREIQVPAFSIPSDFDLTLPLLGMVEVSAKVNSNYYNWEGAVSGGNNSVEFPSYIAQYKVMADGPIEFLSYTSEGTALLADTPEETLKASINASLSHKLIDTSFSIVETVSVLDKVRATGNHKIQAFSPLGLQMSLDATSQFSLASDIFIGDGNMDGSVTIGPLSASTTYSQSFSVEPMKKEARAESSLRVNSPIVDIVNRVKAGYADEELLIESNTNMNNGPIKHTTKFNIGYKEMQLTVQSDSVTKADERMLRSQVDFTATKTEATIRVENQADDTENRAYSLLSGSLNPAGIEINVDASINAFTNHASHKATLTLNKEGLATSCTTTAQRSQMTFENVFHGGVDTTGASMSIKTKGAIQENSAELNVEGKVGSSEVYLNSMYKGSLFDANTRNRVNLRVNEDGLALSNNFVASLMDMETENAHSLTLTFGTLTLRSKTDNVISDRNTYKHDITVDVQGFDASVNVNNDIRIMDVNLVNDVQFKAERYTMELTGSLKGAYSEEELKHTYEISFSDLTATAKCNTNGKLLGAQMTHNTDLEVAGLSVKFNSAANFNSPSLRLDSTVHTVAEPFTLNIDAILNSNGKLNLYGKQRGELYSKFLLKAEPLAFSHSHECRASTSHQLENGASVETSMDNKFNSLVTLGEQTVTLKMTSKLNNHAFDQELTAFNNLEKMGMEMTGAVSTNILTKASENQEYAISGFLKYDKNSDSHFLQIPFIEHLPAVFEQIKNTVVEQMDNSIELLQNIDTKYEIKGKIQEKMVDLKHVIDTFDIKLFVQDLKNFINTMASHVSRLMVKFPHEEISNMLKSIKDTIIRWLKKFDVASKVNAVYNKSEELLSNYEVEKMVESVMDEAVEMMKQYHLREHIQSTINVLKSIDIEALLSKPVNAFVYHLNSFDYKQMVDDMNVYFDKLIQTIESFNYDTFTEDLKQKFTEMSKIPCFGKLYAEFRITSPDYNLMTTADLQNSTTTPVTPEFTANINSQATSTCDLLAYNLDASAHIAVPKMSRLSLSENVKVVHTAFSVDHQGTVTLYGTSAQASSKTSAKATTDPYTAELVSNAFFATESGVSATLETSYNHNVNLPLLEIFSETSMKQKAVALVEAGTVTLTVNNEGSGKCDIRNMWIDEGTHESDMEVVMNIDTVKLTFTGSTDSHDLKMKQNVKAEIDIFRHITIEANAETTAPFITSSVAELKGEAKWQDLKMQASASHNAVLIGNVDGTLSNSIEILVTPYELMFDTKNKENTKVTLPFKLSGKVDLQNDFAITLNSGVQQASWVGLARFNQYKYSHDFTLDNGEKEIQLFAQMNGEANLDVLTEPFTIPEMTVPFFGIKTPSVEDFSLWYDTGLSQLLLTTQQTLDMDAKLKYMKNPEMFTIDIDVEPIVNAINRNSRILNKNLVAGRDKAVAFLTTSIDQAKAEYKKHNIELPKALTVPSYKVPVVNIEVSSFTIPLPDPSLITMPSLHVPSALSKLTLPKITLPKMQRTIMIPVMGDLKYEFSMKTAVLTVKAGAGFINQDDIVVHFDASSSSEFDVLTGKIEGTTTLNRNNGVKLASALSLEHTNVGSKHDSTISLNNEGVDAFITNSARVTIHPFLALEFNQELFANAQEGLIVSLSAPPPAGLIGFQLQTKRPAQVKGRLYSRYPSDPTTDVDILVVKMSVINSEKLSVKTTWNMEGPYDIMLGVKEKVPAIMSIVTDRIRKTYKEITRLSKELPIPNFPVEQIKEQGEEMYKRAAEHIAALDISDKIVFVLQEYQKKIQLLLDAALEFLRETQFQMPGVQGKMSGLEAYQKISTFVTELAAEAMIKVPQFFTSHSEAALDYIRNIEFTLPGSSHVVSGAEILVDLMAFSEKIRDQMVVIVKSLGDIKLEDIVERLSECLRFSVEKSEEFLVFLKSQDVENLSTWMSDVYTDAINCRALSDIRVQVGEARRIVEEYINIVKTKLQDLFSDMSFEQLNADIQSWIDSMVKRLNAFHNKVIAFLKEITKNAESFVSVSDRQMDIDIPLPLFAKSFSKMVTA